MSNGYTITIIHDSDEEHTPNTAPQTTIKVDTSSGEPRIIEVSIRSVTPDGLSTTPASVVDLEQLVRALTPGTRIPDSIPAAVTQQAIASDSHQTASELDDIHPPQVYETSPSSPKRTYRRMPDSAEVWKIYEQVGTIAGVAKHFGIPRHTAQGWMTRLRKQGG
jgi:hypothetical protein